MHTYKIFIIKDETVIDYIMNDDPEGLQEALDNGLEPDAQVQYFESEQEALAFCEGLGFGKDERATPDVYPLRSFEPADQPFIEAIKDWAAE